MHDFNFYFTGPVSGPLSLHPHSTPISGSQRHRVELTSHDVFFFSLLKLLGDPEAFTVQVGYVVPLVFFMDLP